MRRWIYLVAGLIAGAVGAVLFRDSLLPPEGSPEERVQQLEGAVRSLASQLAVYQADPAMSGRRPGQTFADGTRAIVEDIRDGRPVEIDRVFDLAKPMMRDLSPVLERIRLREAEYEIDRTVGEFSRKYGLNTEQRTALENWLRRKAEDEAAALRSLVARDSSSFEDIIRETNRSRVRDGLDGFMEATLRGEALANYRSDRMAERVVQVQAEADRKVQRLNSLVELSPEQQDEVFAVAARGSRHFDPSMQFEGLESVPAPAESGLSRDEAILQVLTPEQRATYDQGIAERRAKVEEDLRMVGLTLPPDWSLFDDPDFD